MTNLEQLRTNREAMRVLLQHYDEAVPDHAALLVCCCADIIARTLLQTTEGDCATALDGLEALVTDMKRNISQ